MAESCCEAISNIGLDILHRKSKQLSGSSFWPAVESIRALAAQGAETAHFSVRAIIAACVGFSIKAGLAIYCHQFRRQSSQLEMLWEDNRNDCFEFDFAIVPSGAGAKLAWWVDPAGTMAIGLFIIISWTLTVRSELLAPCGKGAPPSFVQQVVFAAIQPSEEFSRIDSATAYQWGEKYIVEVDVIMPFETALSRAHDSSQMLQDKLEQFPNVARAYVHVDHEAAHTPEHRKTR
ncbi:hypothetical protein QFC21_007043 [Naganishia friedmannii]|uniref:Uncharacterized protein n=1 Tax=Naganishia friedmannii TaxID=89922 RepID=A0ACC2UXX5_9TREE|nr:hypothetical protein QFC21_007043 [Naganishia friedmannii]